MRAASERNAEVFANLELDLLVFFASQLSGRDQACIDDAADRGWISDSGLVTETGRAVVRALSEQSGTRSVFRPLYR